MSCKDKGRTRYFYTGNEVGDLNHVGDYNFVAGGPPGSGLSAGVTVPLFFPAPLSRRLWERDDAKLDEKLLDAAYPTIELNWFVEIALDPTTTFRVSDKPIYVQDKTGYAHFYDARVVKAPSITMTLSEWNNPTFEISHVSFTLNNRDGFYNDYLPFGNKFRQWFGANITIKVGFGEKYENYLTIFDGIISVKKGHTHTRDEMEITAYEKLDLDDQPIPANSFSADTYPDIQTDTKGNPVPLIYGDWTEDLQQSWGDITAVCINATDLNATEAIFKVADNSLQSITEIWLHRGNHKEGNPDGPVQIDTGFVNFNLEDGTFSLPLGAPVLTTEISNYNSFNAGAGSGANLITAKDATVDFQALKIQPGDRVFLTATNQYYTITTVHPTQLIFTAATTFSPDDEFLVVTQQYTYLDGDKVSVKCVGKNLNLMQTIRLSDVSTDIEEPTCIAVDFDSSYWVADDASQKIYNFKYSHKSNQEIDFNDSTGEAFSSTFGQIQKVINYSDIDASVTSISGVAVANDDKLWAVDPVQKKVYRYDHVLNSTGLTIDLASVVGLTAFSDISGITVEPNNRFWIADKATSTLFEIDAFSAVAPFVTHTITNAYAPTATEILDIAYDYVNTQLVIADRATNKFYRVTAPGGSLISSTNFTAVRGDVSYVTGIDFAQDGTLFMVDGRLLSIFNYNELATASTNPCFIARDLIQQYGGHTYEDFDLRWNETGRQMADYKCRVCLDKSNRLVQYVHQLLTQYNVAMYKRFGKFSLFWITFDNFRTDGKLVTEKDIKMDSFKPQKEMNQYFNTAKAHYGYRPFSGKLSDSDTYSSLAGISFAQRVVSKTFEMPNLYRREDLDRIIPLLVRLSVPEPEFVDVTFGFRLIREQLHDFLTVWFDNALDQPLNAKSGRRYNHIPCMIRKIVYNLGDMSVGMKLWSLGNTPFNGYTPAGVTVGGQFDAITLSTLGRAGRISPIGTVTGSSTDHSIDVAVADGQDAEHRTQTSVGAAWAQGYKLALMDGATKQVVQILTIQSVSGSTITFVEQLNNTILPTTRDAAGFINGGHYLKYANYDNTPAAQHKSFAFFTRPLTNYPTSRTHEIEEQRGGLHSFGDGGQPYILYPFAYLAY